MPIQGPDLSRYDPSVEAAMYPFVILNLEDPGWMEKAHLAVQAGAKLMSYSWVYHGHGRESLLRAYAAEQLILNIPGAVFVHHWLDYEDGVTPADLDDARTVLQAGTPVGTYGYLAMIQQQGEDFWDSKIGPLWIAYYPAGYQTVPYDPSFSNTARRYGAVMHQWTSVWGADGHGDMNVVLDEDWYNGLGGTFAAPTPDEDHRREVDMVIYHNVEVKDPDKDTATGEWVAVFGDKGPTKITASAAYAHAISGVPWVDKQNTYGIIALGVTLAQARRDAAFWDSKL